MAGTLVIQTIMTDRAPTTQPTSGTLAQYKAGCCFLQCRKPPSAVSPLYIDETTAEKQLARLEELKRTRDNDAVRRSLDALRDAARGTGNTMYPLLDCVRAYATVGEMVALMKEEYGTWREPEIF